MSVRFRSLLDLPPAIRKSAQQQLDAPAETPAPAKYGNVRTIADGIRFDSKLEAKRYGELLQMQAAQLIADLTVHPSFALHTFTATTQVVRVGAYEADFSYRRGEQLIVEDCKSAATRRHALYVWKRCHFELEYGLVITEIERRRRKREAP